MPQVAVGVGAALAGCSGCRGGAVAPVDVVAAGDVEGDGVAEHVDGVGVELLWSVDLEEGSGAGDGVAGPDLEGRCGEFDVFFEGFGRGRGWGGVG